MNQEVIKNTSYTLEKNVFKNNWDSVDIPKNDNIITAIGKPSYFCVGLVDIVNSTKTVARLQQNKVAQYYEIFLNTMAKTINSCQGRILKIMGDSLLFCFPNTCHNENKINFLNVIECGFSIISMHGMTERIEDHALTHCFDNAVRLIIVGWPAKRFMPCPNFVMTPDAQFFHVGFFPDI